MDKLYLVTAYRWGYTNNHQYRVYVGSDLAKAQAMAQAECADRGGKYGCEVVEITEAPDGSQGSRTVEYFPSTCDEKKPTHNHRKDMFQTLGHRFYQFAQGRSEYALDSLTLKNNDGSSAKVLVSRPVEPPQWVVDEVKREEELCEMLSKAGI